MFRSKSAFEKVLDKSTSNLLLEPDLDGMLQLCDMIRGGDVKAKEAASLIKTRVLEEKNPHVHFFVISVLDTVMKNCGDSIHSEVITDTFLEQIKELVRSSKAENVKNLFLEMVQAWGVGFKNNADYKVAVNLYNVMKAEGYKFPPVSNTSDMFKSEKAPTWNDGDECQKCKTDFGLVQRKHHCRACGGIFCNKCTSKQAIIPKFGIEKEVRVCDACFNDLTKKKKSSGSSENDLPAEYLNSALSKQSQEPPKRNEAELKEEEELQLALALSLDEQENKHQIRNEYASVSKVTKVNKVTQPQQKQQVHEVDPEQDPDLARYLNRSYWDKKKEEQQSNNESGKKKFKVQEVEMQEKADPQVVTDDIKEEEQLQNSDIPDHQELLQNLRTSVEIFTNRMRSDQMRGRSIANDSAVQSLFQSINNSHPQLIKLLNDLEEKRLHQEALQDKLAQIKDARAALDALRTEHQLKLQRQAEEAERLRQIQMAQKLEVMRQKKQEYLAYQRQMALQRMAEQESARQARLEQQKQFIQQRAMQPSMLIAGYNTQYLPNQQPGDQQQQFQQQPQYNYQQNIPVQNQQQNVNYSQPNSYGQPNNYGMQGYDRTYAQGSTGQGQSMTNAYNMSGMANTLPPPQQQQVMATAPPPTPQPTPTPQQQTSSIQHIDPNLYNQQQQQYYQQPPSQENQNQQQLPADQNQDLLICFD